MEKIIQSRALNPPDKAELLDDVVSSHRDRQGRSNPQRIKKLNALIHRQHHNPHAINIYFVPYLGEKSQGNAKPKHKRILVGQWTDKATKARNLPERFQLIESLPFRKDSLSRTTAHELGHVLGLKHPDKKTQTTIGLLMGGKKTGYDLTQKEVEIACKTAKNLFMN